MGSDQPDWECFENAPHETTNGEVNTAEHAERAALLTILSSRGGSSETVMRRFPEPDSLSRRLRVDQPQLTVEGREGINELRRVAIEKVAAELAPEILEISKERETKRRKPRSQSLFSKEAAG